MIFAKNNSINNASAFCNIGYSISRHRRRSRFGLWVRRLGDINAAKSASTALARLAWLICVLYLGIFLVRTGLMFCSSAFAGRSSQAGVYSRTAETAVDTPFIVENDGEKGNIRLK
jgi:hypothetical protein